MARPEERSDETYVLSHMLKARALFFSSETRMLSLIVPKGQSTTCILERSGKMSRETNCYVFFVFNVLRYVQYGLHCTYLSNAIQCIICPCFQILHSPRIAYDRVLTN